MNKDKNIQFEDIFENIINNIGKPIFTYEEKYDNNEMLKNDIYFYKNFFLLKNDNSIIKFEYNDIKKTLSNQHNMFIIVKNNPIFKFTDLYYPVVISKNKLKNNTINFICDKTK